MDFSPTNFLETLRFEQPELFLLVLPLLVLLTYQLLFRRRTGAVGLTGVEYLQSRTRISGTWRRRLRIASRAVIVIGLGTLWAAPVYYSSEPLFQRGDALYYKNFVIALDTSPSMNLPADFKGYGGEDLKFGEQGLTRYEMARDALMEFLERFRGERFGLVLFSTEPLLARWPTVETTDNFAEVLENIRRGSSTQLEAFSALTNVDKALTMARKALGDEEGAIILISDAEDDLESLGEAVHRIRRAGIRLYTIGVGISDEVVRKLSEEFAGDPGFRIFRVDSEKEMREAYRLVADVEESPQFAGEGQDFTVDVRWIFALGLLGISLIMLWSTEALLPQTVASSNALGVRAKRDGI